MKNFLLKIWGLRPTKRRLVQLYAALLFNVNFQGFYTGKIYQGNTKLVCMPGLNCYSCPGAVTACPIGSLQGAISSGNKNTLFYIGGILLLYCILFGRMICGWVCPFGLIQELLYKIKTPKIKKSAFTRILSYLKYFVLAFFVIIVPIMYLSKDTVFPAFCKFICPAGTLEGGIGLLSNPANAHYLEMIGPLFTWKFLLLVSTIVGSVFIFRIFCRFVCPLGALYGLFNRISVFGVKVDTNKCTYCNKCIEHCKLDIKKIGDAECIGCGECIGVCPTKAINWKCARNKSNTPVSDTKNKTAKIVTKAVIAVLLSVLLIGAAVFYYFDGPEKNSNQIEGTQLSILTGDGVSGDVITPEATGKITIVNFWGTWCGPCVKELPYFDQIATDYKDSVTVIAVHTYMVSDTAPAYISEYYPETDMIFAVDFENEAYYNDQGGRGTYPYTVILNENGEVVESFVKALEYDDLKEVVEQELNN
ncbi:MAG: 4Fe-4S binding protein [Clostridia bacterium]|nr:4Fe-4S binding protein [Clostridia bacterium]